MIDNKFGNPQESILETELTIADSKSPELKRTSSLVNQQLKANETVTKSLLNFASFHHVLEFIKNGHQ